MSSLKTKKRTNEFNRMCSEYETQKTYKEREIKSIKSVLDKCKKNKYKYGQTNISLRGLLEILIKENKERVIDFIELFPFSGLKGGSTVNQSLIFEALWVIIFLCSFDDIRKKNFKRIFKKRIEDSVSKPDNRSLKDKLNNTYVSESHSSGIADIYFEEINIKSQDSTKQQNKSDILCNFRNERKFISQNKCSVEESGNLDNEIFLFSAKYLINERGISGYDIAEIYNEAIHKVNNPRIVLLVKNSDEVKRKKIKSKKLESNLVKDTDIYGINELNLYYNKLRENLISMHKGDINKFINDANLRNNNIDSGINKITLRFHQQFIVNYTISKIINKSNPQHKFVWGAVPRSGKTFMIGGIISQLKPDNIILFLGAVTETNKQFEEQLFDTFKGDFSEYKIYSRHSENKMRKDFTKIKLSDKNIILISLQKGWQEGSIGKSISEILKSKHKSKMVFFDESHQGGKGTSVENMLNKYVFNHEYGKFPFIMVTATFATPLLRFGNKNFWDEQSCLVQWSYEDIEYMKELDKDEGYEAIIERLSLQGEDGQLRIKHFNNVLENFYKNGVSRGHLADYYTREYPELIVMCPSLETSESDINKYNDSDTKFFNNEQIDIAKIFELKKFKKSPSQFKYEKSVTKLLEFINNEVYTKLLLNRFHFDVLKGKPHSQLWFLPTSLKSVQVDEGNNGSNGDNEESNGFIEQIQFLLAEKIINSDWGEHFCVLLMHGQKAKLSKRKPSTSVFKREFTSVKQTDTYISEYNNYDTKLYIYDKKNDNKELCLSTQCVYSNDIGKCIENQQQCAFAKNKNLIILTGARLRLGISMPCVDVALHMDPISNVDTIYQSMFRVLTGTEGKQKGYFIDLLKERMIRFVYQYNNYTNKLKKTRLDIKGQKTHIQQKLFSWNFNGLNQFSGDSVYKNIYKNLVNAFGLTDNSKFSENLEKYQENLSVKEILLELDITVLKDIYKTLKQIGFLFNKTNKGKISIDLISKSCTGRCGKSKEGSYLCSCNETCESDMTDCCSDYKKKCSKPDILKKGQDNSNSNSSDNKSVNKPSVSNEEYDDENPNETDIYNAITEYIKSLFSLYILFYDDKEHCKDFKDLEKRISKPIYISDYENLCKHDNKILECYLKFIIDSKTKSNEMDDIKVDIINQFKDQFKKILSNLEGKDIQKEELNKFYCFIFDKINMLKESAQSDGEKIESRCSKITEQSGGGRNKTQKEPHLIENETVLETIRKYLSVRDEEKKLFGEVFTPIELVCEMLDKLPDEVWKDPKLKWLDPANGIGNYPVVAYYKLMENLKDVNGYENNTVRSKHIIENMLFMVELNPVNVKVCKKIFKMIDPDVTPNIYNKDFLVWSSQIKNKFDVIMGNPPYQHKKAGQTKSQAIWPNFVETSIKNCLKENGYLVFVHPVGWRNTDGDFKKVFNFIQERDLQHLTMRTFQDGAKTFGGSGTNFDYYCVKNTLTKINKTKINDIDRNEIVLDLNNYDFIPSGKFDIFDKLIKGREKVNILYSSNNYETRPDKSKYPTSKDKKGKFIYEVVNSITKKDGPKFIYTTTKNDMFVPKVIWSNGLGTYPIVDNKGDYGLTQFSYGIQDIPENLEFIKNAMNDDKFIELMEYVKFTNNKYNYKIIGAFKKDFWKEFDYKTNHVKETRKSKITKKAPINSHQNNNVSQKISSKVVSSPKTKKNKTPRSSIPKTPPNTPKKTKQQNNNTRVNSTPTTQKKYKFKKCPKRNPEPPCQEGSDERSYTGGKNKTIKKKCCYKTY